MKKLLATSLMVLTLGANTAFAEAPEGKGTGGGWEARKAEMEATLAKLPKEKADLVRASMEKQREAGKDRREKVRTLFKEAQDIMTADKFDKQAYLAKMKEINDLQTASHQARAESIADVASQLNADERRIMADTFGKHKGKGKGKHASRKGKGAPDVKAEQ